MVIILSVMVIGTIVSTTAPTPKTEKSTNTTDFTNVTLKTPEPIQVFQTSPENPTRVTHPRKVKDFHPLANSLRDFPEKTTENGFMSNNLL